MVDNAADNLVVVDEHLTETNDDEDTSSSSGSSVDVLTVSQLSDPSSKMITINPADGFLLISDEDDEYDEDYKPDDEI